MLKSILSLTIAITLIIYLVIILYLANKNTKLNNTFYNYNIFPQLNKIKDLHQQIINELPIAMNTWIPWPETNLYPMTKSWTILPLNVFGIWSETNCKKMPVLAKFLKTIPNLKMALLSKMGPQTKLIPHRGWGFYSNNVLRCHYGLVIPKEPNSCYVSVDEDIEYHAEGSWLIFDDSKLHFAENASDSERIILIVDIERPKYIKKGDSKVGDTEELQTLVREFMAQN
jgi:aspartyl/asparaginyl beta-hydroxylase (cupin superfamily)